MKLSGFFTAWQMAARYGGISNLLLTEGPVIAYHHPNQMTVAAAVSVPSPRQKIDHKIDMSSLF
jgi:hypothetical protein